MSDQVMNDSVLMVDDEPMVLQGYRRSLHRSCNLHTATSGHEALKILKESGPFSVIVADMRMPIMDGLELLQNASLLYPSTIRIMLTGNNDQKTAADAVNRGSVYKFFSKPCNTADLKEAIQSGIQHYHTTHQAEIDSNKNVMKVEHLQRKLSYQSQHDILTGLANRTAFEAALEVALRSAKRENKEHAICFVDVDHLHTINDTYSHSAGDQLLRQIGSLLSYHRRSGDVVSRISSDQFCILFQNCDIQQAEILVRGIHQKTQPYEFLWTGNISEITTSIGLVPINQKIESVTELFSVAETACNVAKDLGRNRIHIASKEDQQLTGRLSESHWVSKINKALREDLFRLHRQRIEPVIYESNPEGEHYEILIRMIDDDGTIIRPDLFLPAAENYHLSPKIDRWVISKTIHWLSSNPTHLKHLQQCSINLSGHSFCEQNMAKFIISEFEKSPILPEKISFEVTETAAMANLESAMEFMTELKEVGFNFSLDDFGTGLSSFAYLKTLPVDYLKIDGAFVREIHSNVVDWTMVKSINDIGQIMGKKTIAEFVENEEILNQLKEIGVDYAQGYLFGVPEPLDTY